ncbi:AT-rich interactive domain-containing protein 2-like [Lytechinus pictus]|uniref:AT-rich interactive domain-containing protein 2-like n=1 Tax=Lytechinus pictus TaxID=7653 RepID=UPI0030BA2956
MISSYADKIRQTHGFAKEKCRTSEYDRILHSLQSGLPNEVDFAINICTLLSNEGKHVIHLEKAPMFIDLLLAHAGIFYEGPGSLRKLYEEDWVEKTRRKFVQFWYDTISDKEVREVIGPGSKKPEDKRQYKDIELFAVRKMGLSDVEGQRILQIAIIFRNLSFESHHISTMASHRTLYRFLLLLAHNSCTMLQQLGMDTLTNICNQVVLDSIDYVSTQLMLHTIHKGLLSQADKFVTLRSMELIEKLMMVDNNLDLFQRCMEPTIYVKIVNLLTIHDIQLLLGALEVMLVMSEREEPFCTRLSSVHHSIDVLVCLITLDAQSLGADAFLGIKIVDHVPDGIHHPIVTMGKPGATPNNPPQPPAKLQTPPAAHLPRPLVLSNSSASPTPPPPAQGGQPIKDADMESLACQWLGAHYDIDPEASITNIDLYAEYLSACGKIIGRNILNSNDFMRCVKIVFPAVEGKKTDSEAGPQFLIAGIKRRRVPLPWKWQPSQSAPSPGGNMTASAMIARMAQRHSPSPTVSPSPPPKGGTFHQGMPPGVPPGIPQRQLVAPPSGLPAVQLPGQVHGQIPGHIHAPVMQSHPPSGQGPTPGQILGQTGQLPSQIQIHTSMGGQVSQGGPVMTPRAIVPSTLAQAMQPQVVPQPQVMQPQMGQVPQGTVAGSLPGSVAGTLPGVLPGTVPSIGQNPQQGSYTVGGNQIQRPEAMQQQLPQGAPLQQPVPQSSQGENVSVADIVAGNMRVPQQQLNFGLQQTNGKPLNGQMGPAQSVNGPQNYVGTPTAVSSNPSAVPSGIVSQAEITMPPQTNMSVPSSTHLQEQSEGISAPTGNGQHHIQSDTNSESSIELNSKSRSRSRNGSGKSAKKSPSRQSSKSPSRGSGGAEKSPNPSDEDARTEKCKPPLKVPLPDGEVRIEKIPNMHAVGVEDDDEDAEDRTDLAEGIVRQIAGSPVLNQSSCSIPMEENESMMSEAETVEDERSQTPKMNGETSTPDLPQPQQMQGLVSTVPESVGNSQAGVFSQPQQQTKAQVTQQFQMANSNKQPATSGMATQAQPQQQYVIQQQIPAQAVVSRGVVNVQMHGNQAVLQTQAGNMVQSHPVTMSAGTVVANSQGTVYQTQGGSYVQVQPQIQMQGHQTVIHNQTNFQGQQFQSQVPLQVTLVQQPPGQSQGQQQVQQQQVSVVTGVQHLQPGQTMIMTNTNSKQQGNFAQATILSQTPGQLVVQNVSAPPRNGPKPILPQPPPVSTMAQAPRAIYPQPAHFHGTQNIQFAQPIQPHQVHATSVAQVQGNAQNVQIARFPGMQRLQGPLSPTNRDSPLIKRLLQQGPALQATGGQQQLQVIQPQQGQIVLNAIGQSQGAPMTVQTQGQTMPLSHVQVVTQFPQGMTVQSSPTIGNIPQIQLHHQPILPAPPGTTSPNVNMKDTKSKKNKSKHKKKDKDKDKEREKNKNGSMKNDQNKVPESQVAANGEKDSGKGGYSINVISEEGDKKVVGVVCNGLPVPVGTRMDSGECNNSVDSPNQDTPTKQGLPNGYMNDKLHSGIKLAKDGIASKDIESLLKKTPQTIGDKVDSVVEQMKRDMSSSAENGILADKLGKPVLNHVLNGDMGSHAEPSLLKDNYDSNKTVSDRLDKLLHGAVPNLSQPNIPNASTPNPKSLVAFCHEIRPSFPSTVPSVTVGAVANANNNNQQTSCQSVPLSTSLSGDTQTSSAASNRTQSSVDPTSSSEARMTTSSSQVATSAPLASTTSTQSSLPLPAQQPPSPLTVQVSSPSTASPCFKRPIDDVLSSPDPKQSTNPAPSPTTPAPTPPSPSTPRSGKKRRRHSSSSSTSSSSRKSGSVSGKSAPAVQKYICEWKGCCRKLVSAKALHTHTCLAHVLTINYRGICEWDGCDRIQRQRWSVVSHIMEKHCSEQAIQASMDKRAQRAAQPTPPPSQDSSPQPPPIIYNAHTAYHAIRRSLNTPSLNEFLGENEGPVTKSIRLTAALILKNIASHSALGRREIRKHELLLARLAISNTESSTTLAKCLNKLVMDS